MSMNSHDLTASQICVLTGSRANAKPAARYGTPSAMRMNYSVSYIKLDMQQSFSRGSIAFRQFHDYDHATPYFLE